MPEFSNFRNLENALYAKIYEAMDNQVAEKVKQLESEHVFTDVYDAYTSQEPYARRRKTDGGLADTRNMFQTTIRTTDGIEMSVKNLTDGNPNVDYTDLTNPPGYLAGIIENGRLPDRKGLYAYNRTGTQDEFLQARTFIENTRSQIEQENLHVKYLKDALKENGLDIE